MKDGMWLGRTDGKALLDGLDDGLYNEVGGYDTEGESVFDTVGSYKMERQA